LTAENDPIDPQASSSSDPLLDPSAQEFGAAPSAQNQIGIPSAPAGDTIDAATEKVDARTFNDAVRKFRDALDYLPTVAVVKF
jgi:hypothetical protein